MRRFLLSIVIPVYNREKYIGKCLESIFRESLRSSFPVDVIVVDDGSGDSSLKVAEEAWEKWREKLESRSLVRFISFALQENSGVNAARNRGVARSVGEFVYFLDSDNYIPEGAFDIIKNYFENVEADLYLFETVSLTTGKKMDKIKKKNRYISYREYICKNVGELTPVVRSFYLKRYPLPEDISGGEGLYWASLIKMGVRVYLVDKPVRLYDETPENRLSIKSRNFRRLGRVYEAYIKSQFLDLLRFCPVKALLVLLKYVFYSVLGRLAFAGLRQQGKAQ